ncbi:rhodanese-like domain-containing protein [Leptolyngbya sp. 7M]|uniref:rhodanese-like domain-containing protein n=1 Tax=Leptolyngbya sp. 7M TaxID=2812896 RepID=UPI001B8D6A19|nr:rhodanese-like domain-containing protein [Leptolyngbya sp. 7M]QYO66215.1 hypothetical protein JVX88_05290 [Leptolyngbya sp. 7M]
MTSKTKIAAMFAIAFSIAGCQSDNANVSQAGREILNTQPSPVKNNIPFPSAKRISLADAKTAYDAGTAVFIDTHSEASFTNEHITGAINVPTLKVEEKFDSIPKGKKIIAYCS